MCTNATAVTIVGSLELQRVHVAKPVAKQRVWGVLCPATINLQRCWQ
jgi:hypothetical protein